MSLGYIGEPLPKVWCAPLLTELTTPKQWKTISTKSLLDEGYTVYGANGKIGYFDQYTHEHPTIMITCRGATCGNLHISEPFSYINGNAMALDGQPTALVGLRFLYFALKARGLDDTISGSAQPQITGKGLSEVRLPLPPLAEQKVIADKLDTLLAQVENTKARLECIPQILKRFRQSVLAAAVSGKLTEEWREQAVCREATDFSLIAKEERKRLGIRETRHTSPAESEEPFRIPRSWVWRRLGNVALKITDGAHNTPKLMASGYPYVMAKDLTGGQLDFSENRYISEKDHRELYLKCFPEAGDLLVVNIGAGTGNNVLVDVDFEFSFKNIAIIKRPSFIVSNYLKFFFDSQKQRIFDEQTRGGAQPFLSLTTLNDIAFALPPVDEQTEIVRRVDQLFAHADRIEQQVNKALARVNNLTQSILAKAFRGELTEQWRKDNPELISGENSAEALLEKIKAERAAIKPVKKTRKRAAS
ncbi:restriction endonuclease subunit S [Granulosicoccaceae sp. 1_MG-2023]|nr:restriction endonuclease subunit S [Granulosicoccaceae sp. 1_MG-2023]